MVFSVTPDAEHPDITNEGMVYEGQRYRVTCALAGKPYGQPFGLDIAFADPILGEPDIVVADDVLGFAGIAPPTLRLYPLETHIAEKLHAYTLPRKRRNSRVKDLPDIALLAGVREVDGGRLRAALEQTFTSRKTHALPDGRARAGCRLGRSVCPDGRRRRAPVGRPRGARTRCRGLPEPRARRHRPHVAATRMGLAIAAPDRTHAHWMFLPLLRPVPPRILPSRRNGWNAQVTPV